ncbi:MAG TPA: bifunctional oligoribonuclease/PAP phosphatase NrnA [Deltaproteobacteria bacterium]|nr:bifunctional oligoribonuclease/PAP phosphatase NrnA [Deltaproteobacteria bacterium]HXK48315.1 bifunctional oligoribonuclease/PAP phosphatase NrnA [Deltaproteobacteria bacterium]
MGQRRRILIVCHNNPDPDTIASAAALKSLFLHTIRGKATICYGGIIGRAENRQLTRRLKIDMIPIREIDFKAFSVICLVDTQPGTGNNSLPKGIKPHIVIDHHIMRSNTANSAFFDVRPTYGSTSTIMTEYLRELDLPVDKMLATGLFYGLKTDTNGLLRSATKADLEAFNYLLPKIAPKTLSSIENPRIPKSYFLKFADGINNSIQYGDVIVSQMGKLHNPDIAAEMADFLLRMENIHWSLCIGEYRDEMIMSVRTTRRGWWAGRVAIKVLRGLGTGGGHEKAAGGRVNVTGMSPEDRQELKDKIIERFLKIVGSHEHKERRLLATAA